MVVVDVNNLEKSYGDLKAVDSISFTVEEGEICGLLGPNGAGKTTTIECIEGLRLFEGGTIRVLGMDPMTEGSELRKIIGMQLQESALQDDIKVWEAMDLFASFYTSVIDWESLLEQLGLSEKRGTRFSKLSGGQKQKLYIALAMVNDPQVIFFDELTSGLDPQSRHVMWDIVREVRKKGKTIFLTTHFMDEAEFLCDRVLIIDHGKVVAMDTPGNLIKTLGMDNRVIFISSEDITEETLKSIESVTRVEKNGELYTISGRSELLIKKVIDFLAENNIPFQNVKSEHPNLEDAFLKLTGRKIRQ